MGHTNSTNKQRQSQQTLPLAHRYGRQEAQLSQRGRTMLRAVEYFYEALDGI